MKTTSKKPATKTTPTGKRRIAAAPAKAPSQKLTTAAVEYYVENKKTNAAKSKADKARKTALKLMGEEGIRESEFETNIDGKKVQLILSLAAGVREVSDMDALLRLYETKKITREQFIEVTSAAKGAVEDTIGKPTWTAIAVLKTGEENVKVAPKG